MIKNDQISYLDIYKLKGNYWILSEYYKYVFPLLK